MGGKFSLFLNPDKTRKSAVVLWSFLLALLFCVIFGAAYALLTDPLYHLISIGGAQVSNVLHCVLIALVGTAVCCCFFALRDKRLVPYAFVGLAVFVMVFYLAACMIAPENRGMMISLVTLYGAAPVLVGNLVSWAIYWKVRKPSARG